MRKKVRGIRLKVNNSPDNSSNEEIMQKEHTLKNTSFSDYSSGGHGPNLNNYLDSFISIKGIREQRQVHDINVREGELSFENYKVFCSKILEMGFYSIYTPSLEDLDLPRHSDHLSSMTGLGDSFFNENLGCVTVFLDKKKKNFQLSGKLIDKNVTEKIYALYKELVSPIDHKGTVYSIQYENGEFSLVDLGIGSFKLEQDNYSESIIEKYHHIVKDLNSDKPCGKLVLMEGPPGSGKTSMVRSMLDEITKKNCVIIVPPTVIQELANPSMVSLFLNNKSYYAKDGSFVLIVEDADNILVTRGVDNITSIQSLLNLSDGIVGALLDIRIVATTNAVNEVDEAVLRPGRLCSRLEIGKTTCDRANKIYERLTGQKGGFTKEATLAEIYRAAHDFNNKEKVRIDGVKKNEVGFGK
jgi:hypothetical protein